MLLGHFYPLLWGHFTPCYCDIFPLFIGIFNFVLFIYFSHLHVCDGVSHNFLGQLFDPSGDFQNCLDSVCVGQHQRFVHQWKNLWWTPSREKKTQIWHSLLKYIKKKKEFSERKLLSAALHEKIIFISPQGPGVFIQ